MECKRCHGTGTYRWGAVVNGVPMYAGSCYRCNGEGVLPEHTKQHRRHHIEPVGLDDYPEPPSYITDPDGGDLCLACGLPIDHKEPHMTCDRCNMR